MTTPVKTRVARHRKNMRLAGYKYRSYWVPVAVADEADRLIKQLTVKYLYNIERAKK